MATFNYKSQKRVLIANRGEIAIRIAKALKELGHIAVGLRLDYELKAAHLEYCDEWVHINGATHRDTFLNVPAILKIIKDHKIDGVHPGYGFLSENAEFADTVEKAGVVFIGPNSKAIRMMGDKATSKKIAKEAGVPTVPGSIGSVASVVDAKKIAEQIGYPVLLKASAGGGGKGMRTCFNSQELENNFEPVKREALASFGCEDVLVEKFVTEPKHIEVQILADKKGNIFHLFERECSIQRRHQKIIEEAPSPFINEDEILRKNLCETAVKLARAVGYDSAGTVEFIMDEKKNFYFLEMNTRIQVEHPVTEEITGIDLMVSMIQGAFGEDFGIKKQSDITKRGNSIECRICAEDPETMLPAPGTVEGIEYLNIQGMRFDHCLYPGLKVTPSFDPMVGKLIVRANDRLSAIRKMRASLENMQIAGLKTNISLHKKILDNEIFISGNYSTKFIEKTQINKFENKVEDKFFMKKIVEMEIEKLGI